VTTSLSIRITGDVAFIELVNPRLEGMSFVVEGAVLNWMFLPFGRIYRAIDYPALVVGR